MICASGDSFRWRMIKFNTVRSIYASKKDYAIQFIVKYSSQRSSWTCWVYLKVSYLYGSKLVKFSPSSIHLWVWNNWKSHGRGQLQLHFHEHYMDDFTPLSFCHTRTDLNLLIKKTYLIAINISIASISYITQIISQQLDGR